MVLQRDRDDPIFGTAGPGAFVQVEIAGQKIGATADSGGNWQVEVRPLRGPGPYAMTVTSNGESVSVTDIMVGEVWIASGQSNMEFEEQNADDYFSAQTAATADIRMFTVKKVTAERPLSTIEGNWDAAFPATVGHFSAVGLAFARELEQHLHVPIGIIHTSWGGTPCEAWTSKEALQRDPVTKPMIDEYVSGLANFAEKKAAYDQAMELWIDGKKGGENQGFDNGWASNEFKDSDWKTVPAASKVDDILGREFEGAFWFRQTIQLPDSWYGKQLKLELGAIDDYDNTYFNGIRVGRTDDKTENAWSVPRVYTVAPGVVRKGANTIAVRVFNAQGPGGMTGPVDAMKIGLADGSDSLPLNGVWRFKVEQELDPNAPRPHAPLGPGNPSAPASLFNGMIAPLIPYGIRGAIWYQGESNVGRAEEYSHLFPDMIRDWRARWGEGLFPFYFVQLANYLPRKEEPGESAWAELREAQNAALNLSGTGEAVIIDIGEANDIHPKNKKEVGRRLALQALGKTYHKEVVYDSPSYGSMTVNGNTVRVEFDNGSLTTTDGQPPRGFAVAGSDKKFYWADARIDGSAVVLSCPQVPLPIAVRYGWADNPDVNLTNHAGLPARPFRTDGWTQK
jgi:sialate O-acetylesterase